jgi:hypothetical protein
MKTDEAVKTPPVPWWREPMVWLVVGGPAVVVVAAIATGVIAWRGADALVIDPVAAKVPQASPLQPALAARNHAATPR